MDYICYTILVTNEESKWLWNWFLQERPFSNLQELCIIVISGKVCKLQHASVAYQMINFQLKWCEVTRYDIFFQLPQPNKHMFIWWPMNELQLFTSLKQENLIPKDNSKLQNESSFHKVDQRSTVSLCVLWLNINSTLWIMMLLKKAGHS